MASKANESLDNELETVRNRLLILNKKVKKYSTGRRRPPRLRGISISKTPSSELKNASLEEMRDKLRFINDYFKKRMAGGAALIAPASEIVEEKMEPFVEEVGEPIPDGSQEKSTLDLPKIEDEQDLETAEKLGVGLDLGTAYIVASREIENSRVFVRNERNAFLSVRCDKATQELLGKLKIKYASMGDSMYVMGNLALDLANLFNRETQRSMKMGILNPSEAESIPILKLLIQNILWPPREKGEVCCFSIPASPVDKDQDTIYHRGVFEGILRSLGYEPAIVDEGYAVVLSELGYNDFTGIGVSCGGGSVNVCAAYRSVSAKSFSITRGGDWVDQSAASVLGIPTSKVTTLKEQGMKLKSPASREEEAIVIYFKNYIRYFLEKMAVGFNAGRDTVQFRDPVDIVFAGGSSLIGDFLDVVKEEARSVDIGIPIREMKLAAEPFTSVARGCLFHAINMDEHNK